MFDLAGKVAYLPGGHGGLGEAIAWGLAMAGAKVVVSGLDGDRAVALAAELGAAGHEAAGLGFDARSLAEIDDSTAFVVDTFGGLDILVNCVGMQREEVLGEVTEEAFDEVYAVNLKAAMFLAQSAARHQKAGRRGGRQVHIASVRSALGLAGRGYSAYCATKGALVTLVKQHAAELAPHAITVNAVAPTFVYTEMVARLMADRDFHDALIKRIPLARIADPKDVVGPVLFFASPAADYVTGQTLYVDGGLTACQ